MKTGFTTCCATMCLVLPLGSLGQATFVLRNGYSVPPVRLLAPVFDAQGDLLSGTNYVAELYGGPSPEAIAPAVGLVARTRVTVPFTAPGYFISLYDVAEIPTVPGSGWSWLQVRVWDSTLGRTYEEAAGRGLGACGESPIFYAQGGDPSHLGPPAQLLIGLRSFQLRAATGVLLRGIRLEGDQVVVDWYSGFRRYQLQQSLKLGAPWHNLGEPATNLSAVVQIGGPQRFLRVIGLLE